MSGEQVIWTNANNKVDSIQLDTTKQRRLAAYLLKSKVREVKGLPADFINGLAAAYKATDDPAANMLSATNDPSVGGPWKMHLLTVEGFGGVNVWNGKPLNFSLDGESLLLEGPNGSGKSSLTAAIVWCLTGERPRDQNDSPPEEGRPVFGPDDKEAGDWPPVAAYPPDTASLKLQPSVSVEITFKDPAGNVASFKRGFDGKTVTVSSTSNLVIPAVLLETGLLMPVRLPQIRLNEGRGRLTDAVQKLTGLDELVSLGTFVQGLCHKGRDYRAYKTAELATAKAGFDREVKKAREKLASVSVDVADFKVSDSVDPAGEMVTLTKGLIAKASDLTNVVSSDLVKGLDLADPQVQQQIGVALAGAEQDVNVGLEGLPTWKSLQAILSALTTTVRTTLRERVASGQKEIDAALAFSLRAQEDNRFRLKALAAQWHAEHSGATSVDECPLCTQSLSQLSALSEELAELRTAGEAATRRLADNLNAISVALEEVVPQSLRRYLSDPLTSEPRGALLSEIRDRFVLATRYQKYLAKFGAIVDAACTNAPSNQLPVQVREEPQLASQQVSGRFAKIERMCDLAEWFEENCDAWATWWSRLADGISVAEDAESSEAAESLRAHLTRLSKSVGEAEPYRLGASALQDAMKQGVAAAEIESEQAFRTEVADALSSLKELGNLADAQARAAISDLSDRIGKIHGDTYVSESLQFQKATLEKKSGLVVRGRFSDQIRVDATLVANTSWLRGVLWAFIFALREEAVEQIGGDVFPVMVLDDPQQTFDSEHRHRWAEQIAKLQKGNPGVQVILATHDELFLSFLAIDGVEGRQTLICSPGQELGHVGLFEGDALGRLWAETQKTGTPAAGRNYMAAVRVFLEGMLKLMLRGEGVDISDSVVGGCREKISNLNKGNLTPWNRPVFNSLSGRLGKGIPQIKYIEIAHHASGAHLGMTEAVDVEKYWRTKLRPDLEQCFRMVRDYRALHGGLTALHAFPPTSALPDGYGSIVRQIQWPIVGTAAALSNGKAADGCMELAIAEAFEVVELKDHTVFRVTKPTLEPVVRPGDLILVVEHTPPTAKSLVAALSDDRLLARRLEIADNHSDVAVLTASAINPRMIAPPVVAKLSTLTLRKIVGVVFDSGKAGTFGSNDDELCDCGGGSLVKAAFSNMQGIVEVSGHSAEPHALDKQFIMIAKPVPLVEANMRWEGRPVIAEDAEGNRYFKRYRNAGNVIILESLEIGGGFAPIVLAASESASNGVKTIWPVLGVLFEKPK